MNYNQTQPNNNPATQTHNQEIEKMIRKYLFKSKNKSTQKKEYIKMIIDEMIRSARVELSDELITWLDSFDNETPATGWFEMQENHPEEKAVTLSKDERIVKVINTLIAEGFILHAYDYHVVKQILEEKYGVSFLNGQKFVEYIVAQGIRHKTPSADAINKKINQMRGCFPEWTWANTDHNEEVRRINIAKQFVRGMAHL